MLEWLEVEGKCEMDKWLEVEGKCEGKTILTLSANSFGMIIRFTDGSCLTYLNGTLQFDETGNH